MAVPPPGGQPVSGGYAYPTSAIPVSSTGAMPVASAPPGYGMYPGAPVSPPRGGGNAVKFVLIGVIAVLVVALAVVSAVAINQNGRATDARKQLTVANQAAQAVTAKQQADFKAADFLKRFRDVQDANKAADDAGVAWINAAQGQTDAALDTYFDKRNACVLLTYRYINDAAAYPRSMFEAIGAPQVIDITTDATDCRYRSL
jgi:hypothetical protein